MTLLRFLELLFQALTLVILLRSLVAFITPGQTHFFNRLLFYITEPILAPLRRVSSKLGGFDFSPFVAIVILQVAVQVVVILQSQVTGWSLVVVFLLRVLLLLLEALTVVIVLRALMTWISPGETNPLARFLYQITEPVLAPLRRILPKFGGLDFSPFVAVVILQVLVRVVLVFLPKGI